MANIPKTDGIVAATPVQPSGKSSAGVTANKILCRALTILYVVLFPIVAVFAIIIFLFGGFKIQRYWSGYVFGFIPLSWNCFAVKVAGAQDPKRVGGLRPAIEKPKGGVTPRTSSELPSSGSAATGTISPPQQPQQVASSGIPPASQPPQLDHPDVVCSEHSKAWHKRLDALDIFYSDITYVLTGNSSEIRGKCQLAIECINDERKAIANKNRDSSLSGDDYEFALELRDVAELIANISAEFNDDNRQIIETQHLAKLLDAIDEFRDASTDSRDAAWSEVVKLAFPPSLLSFRECHAEVGGGPSAMKANSNRKLNDFFVIYVTSGGQRVDSQYARHANERCTSILPKLREIESDALRGPDTLNSAMCEFVKEIRDMFDLIVNVSVWIDPVLSTNYHDPAKKFDELLDAIDECLAEYDKMTDEYTEEFFKKWHVMMLSAFPPRR
ncbi:MAG: hypothetical protein LBB38_00340 [Puniceicoccales bacterium]|nr:hypothetical protein [Puniceicoccales bacterium]